jgi:hypothetical protein
VWTGSSSGGSVNMEFSFVGVTATAAAFVATKDGGRGGPAPAVIAEGRSGSGGWRSPVLLLRDGTARSRGPRAACRVGWTGPTEKNRAQPLPDRRACRSVALWKAVVALLSERDGMPLPIITALISRELLPSGRSSRWKEAVNILRCDPDPQMLLESTEAA